ncbi:hypothetical protein DSO57_1001068 [Entomophthora muscae]|uniref:Uncharacterized protein n=1 Tax=Entomophthora muscae TaxID=34485 RepID=A0ACC2RP43_9FUNG|nr:hypothetical protein DSO57_1001068 [Entomophthora muscae]
MRLQLGIAFLDVFMHCMSIFYTTENEKICEHIGFLTVLFKHMYLGMNISIALNLNLAILCSRKPNKRWEIFYWLASLVVPFILNIPAHVAGMFGRNTSGKCVFMDHIPSSKILSLIYNGVFTTLTISYCLMISIMVIYKVRKENYGRFIERSDPQKALSLLSLKSLICRTCLYPAACFLTYFGSNFVITYFFLFGSRPSPLLYWGRLGGFSRGLLHFFAFLADPMVFKSITEILKSSQEEDFKPVDSSVYYGSISQECEFSYQNLINSDSDIDTNNFGKSIEDFKLFI